jgi:hypothetical protein
MAVNDLAAGATYGPLNPEQLLAGDTPIKTDAAPALADITKYMLIAIRPTGVTPWVHGTDTAANAALSMQPAVSGAQCPYAYAGVFNDALIVAYSGYGTPNAAIDTYAERRAYFTGQFRVGHLLASA